MKAATARDRQAFRVQVSLFQTRAQVAAILTCFCRNAETFRWSTSSVAQ